MVKVKPAVEKRLEAEPLIWLTTVSADSQPQASLVWFWWNEGTFLIYSKADSPKLEAIRQHPRVALNLNSHADGGGVVTFEGTAEILTDHGPATSVPQYIEKYRDGIKRIGMTPDTFAASYAVPIRVTPARLRAW